MEKRYKLTAVQLEAITTAEKDVDRTKTAFEAALKQATLVSRLISAALGVPDAAEIKDVDSKTKELLVLLPD